MKEGTLEGCKKVIGKVQRWRESKQAEESKRQKTKVKIEVVAWFGLIDLVR